MNFSKIKYVCLLGVVAADILFGVNRLTEHNDITKIQFEEIQPTVQAPLPHQEMNWMSMGYKHIDCDLSEELQEYTYYLCDAYNINFEFVMAVMIQESSFRSNIVSTTGDYGLMQINKNNFEWLSDELGVQDFTDPYENIHAGVYVLTELFKKYDDPHQVLMAYNMGESGMKKLWNKGIYTTNYVDNIMSYQEGFLYD